MEKFKVSDEKLNTLMTKVFGLGDCWDTENKCFKDVRDNGTALTENEKKMYDALLDITKSQTGAEILNQLDENKPISIIYDPKQDENVNASCDRNGVVRFYDSGLEESNLNISVAMIHELTHAVQKQQGWAEYYSNDQDGYMLDHFNEAEARIVSAKYAYEQCYDNKKYSLYDCRKDVKQDVSVMIKQKRKLTRDPQISGFLGKLKDLMKPVPPLYPLSEEEMRAINKAALDNVYNDEDWAKDYQKQSEDRTKLRYTKYGKSFTARLSKYTNSATETLIALQKRLHLTKEDTDHYMDPKSLAYYPFDEIPVKETEISQDNDGNTLVLIKENGKTVAQEKRDSNNNLLENIVLSEKYMSIRQYDKAGKISMDFETMVSHDEEDNLQTAQRSTVSSTERNRLLASKVKADMQKKEELTGKKQENKEIPQPNPASTVSKSIVSQVAAATYINQVRE